MDIESFISLKLAYLFLFQGGIFFGRLYNMT